MSRTHIQNAPRYQHANSIVLNDMRYLYCCCGVFSCTSRDGPSKSGCCSRVAPYIYIEKKNRSTILRRRIVVLIYNFRLSPSSGFYIDIVTKRIVVDVSTQFSRMHTAPNRPPRTSYMYNHCWCWWCCYWWR